MSERPLKTLKFFETSKLNTPRPLPQTATISECRYRWLRVPDLNLTFDKVLSSGGRSEKISQIRVVWGNAIAVSRHQLSDARYRAACMGDNDRTQDNGAS
jgi:hypothetical protein